jgi:hypothetical protein
MIRRTASAQPRRPVRGTPRTRQVLTVLGGLAVFLAPAIGFAPAALASLPSPAHSTAPVPPPPGPPPTSAPAHLPLWVAVTLVAATIVLSVATTLITLAAEHRRRARRTPAADDAQPAAPGPAATPGPEAGHGEILGTYHLAGHDRSGTDSP